MKTSLLLIAFLLALTVGSADGAILFATGTLERLSLDDYQLDLSYIIYPDASEYPVGGPWEYIYPHGGYAVISGDFTTDYEPSFGLPYLSAVIHPTDPSLFLTLGAQEDWVFENTSPSGLPLRTLISVYGYGSFTAALPQEIGTSSVLTQTPEASSFILLALGLVPLGLLLTPISLRRGPAPPHFRPRSNAHRDDGARGRIRSPRGPS